MSTTQQPLDNSFNARVLALIKEYPTDGTHKYFWGEGGFAGVTRDLIYQGVTIAKADEKKNTYCCGLTFEVWFRLFTERLLVVLPASEFKKIRADWFVATGKRMGSVDALIDRKLGDQVYISGDPKKVLTPKPGDFMQIWRENGSGHSVIYLGHNDKSVTYWSTQPSTNGIGTRTELRVGGKNNVKEIYLVRAK